MNLRGDHCSATMKTRRSLSSLHLAFSGAHYAECVRDKRDFMLYEMLLLGLGPVFF